MTPYFNKYVGTDVLPYQTIARGGCQVVDSYFSQLNKCAWTVFCRDPSEHNGTIWIGRVEATTAKQAANLATGLCADAWGREDDEDIICIGVIEGNITVALWDDENHCGG